MPALDPIFPALDEQRRRGPGLACALGKEPPFGVLATLADVERCHRAVVAHHPGSDFAGLALAVGEDNVRRVAVRRNVDRVVACHQPRPLRRAFFAAWAASRASP